MKLLNKLSGSLRSTPGWEQRTWRRLCAILMWGTLLPVLLAGLNRLLTPNASLRAPPRGAARDQALQAATG